MNKITKSSNGISLVPLDSALLDHRRIFIEGEITTETAASFFKQVLTLNEESSTDTIDLYINSTGGSVSAGLSIYDTIKLSKAPIRSFNICECYSMAALIFSSGTGGRYLFPNAKLMLHEPLLGRPVTGNVSSIHSLYETMNDHKQKLNAIIAENSGKTLDEVNAITDHDHYFSATEAIEYGLADEIVNYEKIMRGE